VESQVKAIWNGKEFVDAVSENYEGLLGIIVDRTNFYAEQGGQIFDSGFITLKGQDEPSLVVNEVQSFGGYILHMGHFAEEGSPVAVGDDVTMIIEHERRSSIMNNHTSTHMVNFALRSVLGDGVDQKGSLVDSNKFRFDFSFGKPLNQPQLAELDQIVVNMIQNELKVYTKVVTLADAKKIQGLRAVFGEVYPDPVRVVSIGRPVEDLLANPENADWMSHSIEFCGGTHLTNTKEAVSFTIVTEEALAAGVRRITAVTGKEALQAIANAKLVAEKVASASKLSTKELQVELPKLKEQIDATTLPAAERGLIYQAMQTLNARLHENFKEAQGQFKDNAAQFVRSAVGKITENPTPYYVSLLNGGSQMDIITEAVKSVRIKCSDTAVLVISPDAEKKRVSVLAHVPPALVQKGLKGNEWAAKVVSVVGGKGGGKPEIGQGSGNDVSKVDDALREAETYAKAVLGL